MRGRNRSVALALVALMVTAAPALADVKSGFDMWNKGDYFGATREWRPLAIAGDPIAQYNLAQAYKLGRGVPLDMKMAESWYAKAAAQGHFPSRDNYGLILFQNGDRPAAMPYIEESASRGEPRAQYVLGTALFNGDGVSKDWVRAYALMTRASAAGIAAASSSLAQMDKYIPLDQRQRGLAMARTFEDAQSRPQIAGSMIGDTQPTRPQTRPSSIGSEDLPPSTVGAPPMARPAKTPPVVVATVPRTSVKVAQKTPPRPPVVEPDAAPSLASAGGWRVQLGAFGNEANARRAWSSLSGRLGGLSANYVRAGAVVRLQAGPLRDKAAAQRACAAAQVSCLPVAP